MQTKSKYSFKHFIIIAFAIFSSGLLEVAHLMRYSGIEYNFIADNWIFPSTLFLALVFVMGWLTGDLVEYFFSIDKRKLGILTFLGFTLVYLAVGLSFILVSGFAGSIVEASAKLFFSGGLFRLSAMNSAVIAKIYTKKQQPINP